MVDPVITIYGNHYEREAILCHLESYKSDPIAN